VSCSFVASGEWDTESLVHSSMAHRRMFSKAIVCSARFLKMPTDSQTLYFHLGMATDDDGVVEAWSVLKTTGSAEDNLRVLASKGFIRILNEDLVSYIMDWDEHNEIRSDRLVPSQYRELLIQMVPEVKLKEPKRRADLKPVVPELPGRPVDNQRTAEDRLGKDRINSAVAIAPRIEYVVEEEEKAPRSKAKYPHALEVFSWFPNRQKSWESLKNVQEREYAEYLYERGEETVKQALRYCEKHKGDEHFYQITKPSDLEKKWEDIRAYAERNR